MLDFQEIKHRLSYNDVLSFLALNGKRVGEQFRAKCPACKTDNERSLVLTEGKGAYCFAAGKGGDILWLVSHVRGIGVRQAAQEIADHFHLDSQPVPQEPAGKAKATPTATQGDTPLVVSGEGIDGEGTYKTLPPLTYLQYDHPSVQALLGFSPEAAEDFGIGFAPKGMMKGKVCIPVYHGGKLVGYIGVADDGKTKVPANLKAH